ncbi:MAG: right-handed parallel beta-helix repeat-containing protein [Candidatus Uhrbacteria bacterium]
MRLPTQRLAVVAVVALLAGIVMPRQVYSAVAFSAGDLIKAGGSAVYYYTSDGTRYSFPNEKVYRTWYENFSTVKAISMAQLADIPLRGNVTYKPGVKLVKITTLPRVYAVASGGILRWVKSEAIAAALYGADWNKKVDDISDAFFTNYRIGTDVDSSTDFNPPETRGAVISFDAERGSTAGGATGNASTSSSASGATTSGDSTTSNPPAVLAAPILTDPGALVSSNNPFSVTWSAVSGATSYTLERDGGTSFANPIVVAQGTATSVQDTVTPAATTSYFYRVRAGSGTSNSSWSNVVDVTVLVGSAPVTPITPTAPTLSDPGTSVGSGVSYTVSWGAIADVTGYTLQEATNAVFSSPATYNFGASVTSYTFSGYRPVAVETRYYRIRARNATGDSAWSNAVDIKIEAPAVPVVPTAPTLNDPGDTVASGSPFTLNWNSVAGAQLVTLQEDTNASFSSPASSTFNASVTSYAFSGYQPAATTTHYYRIQARNDAGSSAWSNVVDIVIAVVPATRNVPAQYSTIQAAIDAAREGDTIVIAVGTYNELLTPKSGIVLRGAGIDQTIIQKSGDNAIEIRQVHDVNISGISVKNSGNSNHTEGAIAITNSQNITVSDCNVSNNVAVNGAGFKIDTSSNVTVKNCVIVGNRADNAAGGMSIYGATNLTLENVTIADNTGSWNNIGGLSMQASTVTMKNSIVWNNGDNISISSGVTFNATYSDIGEAITGTGNINQNPLFVDGGDYHLQGTSPCIDTGDPASAYVLEPAPNGGRINMGAYGNTAAATSRIFSVTYAGPDVSFVSKIELANFSVKGNNTAGGTLTAEYTYRNTSTAIIHFSNGIWVGAYDPHNNYEDFGNAQISLAPQQSYTLRATKVVDEAGDWRFWPVYLDETVGSSPYMWHAITVPVQ